MVLPVSLQRLDVPPLSLPAASIRVAQPRCPAQAPTRSPSSIGAARWEVEVGPASENLLTRITRIVREGGRASGALQRKLDRLYAGNGFKQPGIESLGLSRATCRTHVGRSCSETSPLAPAST